jgi:hypothetical protein
VSESRFWHPACHRAPHHSQLTRNAGGPKALLKVWVDHQWNAPSHKTAARGGAHRGRPNGTELMEVANHFRHRCQVDVSNVLLDPVVAKMLRS